MTAGAALDEVARLAAPLLERAGRPDGWVVGGAVRDLLLGRPFADWDVVVPDDPRRAALRYARAVGGSPFPLSERHGAWRVVEPERTVDFAAQAGSLEDDLRRRDFTVNAIAVRPGDAGVADPLGGLDDLERRVLRPASDAAFRDDPVRLLRLPRLAAELDFEIGRDAARQAARDAHLADAPAGERKLAELARILQARDPIEALAACDRLGVLAAVLPEVAALHGVLQNAFHHLDVFGHTLHVLDSTADVAANLDHYFPAAVVPPLETALDERLDATVTVRQALRWAALFHDIAKPHTRTETGHGVKFFGHDDQGAEMADAILARLRAGSALRRFCRVLVREHLRLGFLVKQPLDRRLAYRYALATQPYPLPSVVLSLGDRLATRGERTRQRGIRRHHRLAQAMVEACAALGPVPPPPLVPGDRLAHRLGIAPGPLLGRLVAAVAEEQAAGELTGEEDAVRFGRGWLAERAQGGGA